MKKCEDIAECLEPHRFHLVEDECLKEVGRKGIITSDTSSSCLKKVTVTESKSPRSALTESVSFKNMDSATEEAIEDADKECISIIAGKEADSVKQKKGESSSSDVQDKEDKGKILVRNLLNVSLQAPEETELPNDPGIFESSETDSTVPVPLDETPNWTLINAMWYMETPLGDEDEVEVEEEEEEEEAVVVVETVGNDTFHMEIENNNMEALNNTVNVESDIDNMEEENNTVEVDIEKKNKDVENNTMVVGIESKNMEIEKSTTENLPGKAQVSSAPPQLQSEGSGLALITEKSPQSTPLEPPHNQVRPNCKCEGCLRPNCTTCRSCKLIRKLGCNTATGELRCEGRTCWGLAVPQVPLKMCQVRVERLPQPHQPASPTTPALNNNQEAADKDEEGFEDLVEIVEDKIVPMDISIGSDEEILSVEVITQPVAQPQSPKRKSTKNGDQQNKAVPEPKKLIEFDMFSSIDKDLKRKMKSDPSGKLKRKKNKEQKMIKSRKVVHHRRVNEKNNLQFYSNKKSNSITPSEAERRKQLYTEKFIKSPVKVVVETSSHDKVNITIKVAICSFLPRLLTQDYGQEVSRVIEEEIKKYSVN